ncbi:hypothetical protein ABBQ38_008252 [Trebouxia sp. C0009 RCD-2024]
MLPQRQSVADSALPLGMLSLPLSLYLSHPRSKRYCVPPGCGVFADEYSECTEQYSICRGAADWLGGPGTLFNPSHNLAFAALGDGKKRVHLMRMVFQIVGGVLGAAAALIFIPPSWQRNFYKMDLGPKPGVSLRAAVLAEGTLTYLLNLVILYATSAKNKYLAYWSPLVATVALVITGAELTGPSMNPAFTFGWFTQFGTIDVSEHFYIFWLGPLLGGLLAGLTWRAFVVTKPGQQEGNTVIVEQPQLAADKQKSPLTKKAD